MGKTPVEKPAAKAAKAGAEISELTKKLVLTGADIVRIGDDAELLVGGKNYNTAIISQVEGIRAPEFRAISSQAFHILLDETRVNASLVRATVDKEYNRIDWNDPEINKDSEFLQKFVRNLAKEIRAQASAKPGETQIKLRTFVNNVVEGFATSPEGIDQLRKALGAGAGGHPVRGTAQGSGRMRARRLPLHLQGSGRGRRARGRALLRRR